MGGREPGRKGNCKGHSLRVALWVRTGQAESGMIGRRGQAAGTEGCPEGHRQLSGREGSDTQNDTRQQVEPVTGEEILTILRQNFLKLLEVGI